MMMTMMTMKTTLSSNDNKHERVDKQSPSCRLKYQLFNMYTLFATDTRILPHKAIFVAHTGLGKQYRNLNKQCTLLSLPCMFAAGYYIVYQHKKPCRLTSIIPDRLVIIGKKLINLNSC